LRLQDGAPAAGVRVVAQAIAGPGEPSNDGSAFASLAETDAGGSYRLEGLPPGRYHIAAGFVSSLTYYPGVATLAEARPVTIALGSKVEGIDFALARSAGVRVSGYLRGFPDDPALGVPRVLLQIMAPSPGGLRLMDVPVQPGGKFEFPRVPAGFHNLRTQYVSTPTPIQVGESDLSDVEIKLPPAVMGRVKMDDGGSLPVQLAVVAIGVPDAPALVRLQFRKTSPVTTTTAPVMVNGAFVAFLPPGEYQVASQLLPLGYSVKSITYGGRDLLQSVLAITEQATDAIEVTLTRTEKTGVRVSGRVTGITGNTAPNQAWVMLQTNTYAVQSNIPEQRVLESYLQTDGTFVLEDVPPNFYNLRVLPLGFTQTLTVPNDGLSNLEIKVPASGVQSIVVPLLGTFSVPAPATPVPAGTARISGRVVTIPGTAMPRAIRLRSYSLQHPPSGGFETAVNADGTFQFQGLTGGEFDLNVMGVAVSASRNFTTGGQDITGIEVKVPVAARGRVVMEDGTPLPPPSMSIENAYSPGATGGSRTAPITQRYSEIKSDGTFSVNVVQGEQRISIVNLPPGFSVRSITYGSVDVMANPLRVAVPLSEIVVTLQRN
jgi:hypothetical protein